MITNIRWVIQEDGTKRLQAYDGLSWFYIDEVQWFEDEVKL